LAGRPDAVVAISNIANARDSVEGRFAMNCRCKILTAVLPVAILAGPAGAGLAAAKPARTASIQIPQMLPQGAMPQAAPPQGAPAAAAQTPYAATYEVALDPQGRIFVADRFNSRVQIFDQEGKFIVRTPRPPCDMIRSLDTTGSTTPSAVA
jgi:NHL repeat